MLMRKKLAGVFQESKEMGNSSIIDYRLIKKRLKSHALGWPVRYNDIVIHIKEHGCAHADF